MRVSRARAWVLATAAIVSCGKSSGGGGGGGADAGLHGPTEVSVTWTLAGKPADLAGCMAHGASQIFVNLSGTIDPSLHQSQTVDCSAGPVTFKNLLIENLGTPYVEGTLLDAKSTTVAITGVDVSPMLGTTSVTLAFFAPQNTGGMGGMMTTGPSSSSSSSTTSSSSGGTGGASSSSGGMGGMGGAPSSSSSASSASSGIVDAGGGG